MIERVRTPKPSMKDKGNTSFVIMNKPNRKPVADDEVSDTELPSQMVVAPAGVIVGVAGTALTVIETAFEGSEGQPPFDTMVI